MKKEERLFGVSLTSSSFFLISCWFIEPENVWGGSICIEEQSVKKTNVQSI